MKLLYVILCILAFEAIAWPRSNNIAKTGFDYIDFQRNDVWTMKLEYHIAHIKSWAIGICDSFYYWLSKAEAMVSLNFWSILSIINETNRLKILLFLWLHVRSSVSHVLKFWLSYYVWFHGYLHLKHWLGRDRTTLKKLSLIVSIINEMQSRQTNLNSLLHPPGCWLSEYVIHFLIGWG